MTEEIKKPRRRAVKLLKGLALCFVGLEVFGIAYEYYMGKVWAESVPHESWQESKSGKFAHGLKYEGNLPKPVPYDFSLLHVTEEQYTRERRKYFEHLCKTEAGNYIWETAQDVDTVARLRSAELPDKAVITFSDLQKANPNQDFSKHVNAQNPPVKKTFRIEDYVRHPEALESPLHFDELDAIFLVSQSHLPPEKFGLSLSDPSILWQVPTNWGFPYNSWQVWYNNNIIVDYYVSGYNKSGRPERLGKQLPKITARYGVTWKGFSRPRDREFGIAGGDLIIVDIKDNHVMAVHRNFSLANMNVGILKSIYYWSRTETCGEFEQEYLTNAQDIQANFIMNVLQSNTPEYKGKFHPITNKVKRPKEGQ